MAKRKRTAGRSKSKRKPARRKKTVRRRAPRKSPSRKRPAPRRRRRNADQTDNWVFGLVAGAVFLVFAVWWASFERPLSGELNQLYQDSSKLSTGGKVDYWSRKLAGAITKNGHVPFLTSGPSVSDTAPLIPEKYDCTTFVETVAAFAKSPSPSHFFAKLKAIRYYNSKPAFENRNHFPSLDWIPNNAKNGHIKDVTRDVAKKGGADFEWAEKDIPRSRWLQKKVRKGEVSRSLASSMEKQWKKTERARVGFIPLNDVDDVLEHIPNGAVLNVVRRNNDKYDVLISHQGFVIRYRDKVYFRHATSKGRIQTVELEEYLNRTSRKADGWPVMGINLNEIQG